MFKTFAKPLARFWKQEDGVTAVECALMLALVVAICLVVIAPSANPSRSIEPTIVVATDN